MAKKKKIKKSKTIKSQHPSIQIFDRYPVWITLGLLLVLLLIFYHPVIFQGKSLLPPDQLNSKSAVPFIKDALDRDIYPLWSPYVFSGMPALGSLLVAPKLNIIDYNIRALLLKLPISSFLFYLLNYLLLGGLLYLMLRSRKLNPLACFFGAITVVFIPQFIAFTSFGHNTKFLSLALIPLIFFLVDRLLEKRNILYFSLTALAIGLQMMRAHVQVSYYTFLLVGIYFLFKFFSAIKDKKELQTILRAGLLLAGALVVGVLLSSALYVPVQEYSKYSIRGGGASGGLGYDYAAGWSFHPLEMITFVIPSYMGFGGQTYWGKMPFTDYPLYFGIVVLLFAGIAFVLKRDRFTWFWGVLAIFALFVSFGKELPILYGPMFKALPFFNKFRIPSMIHIIFDISMVVLAAIGIHALIEFKDKIISQKHGPKVQKLLSRYLYLFVAIVGIFALFLLAGKSSYLDMVAGARAHLTVTLRNMAYKQALGDAFKSLVLVAIAVVLVFQYLKNKIGKTGLVISLVVIVLVDLWWVDYKIINPQDATNEETFFAPTPIVKELKKDPDVFRIFPALDEKSGNWYSYHKIQNILGYHAAKLRIYQDFLEETGFSSQNRYGIPQFLSKYWRVDSQNGRPVPIWNPLETIPPARLSFDNAMLDMLNVKYVISLYPIYDSRFSQVLDGKFKLYKNTLALPRAFFPNSTVKLVGRKLIFDFMKSGKFDPRKVAILEETPPFKIEPSDSNTVEITEYDIREIKLTANVKAPAMMVLGDIYYPAGWKAFVNGKETKIYKTNYILRSIFLEPGNYNIEFKFEPKSFQIGLWLSLVTLGAVLILLILGIVKQIQERKQQLSEENFIVK